MADLDLTSTTRAYLEAFEQRNVDGCMQYFAEDATVTWPGRMYRGQAEIALRFHR